MREIKQITLSAGPEGIIHPGHTRTLPKHEAASLVAGGFAEYMTEEPPEKAIVEISEKELTGPEEIANVETVKPKQNGKGKTKQ